MTQHVPNGSRAPASSIPPVTEQDIQGIADMIITRYRDMALTFAAQQMEHFRHCGEYKDLAIWTRIGMAVGEKETAAAPVTARRHVE